ncbi:hypothetical protein JQX13_36220 [Archangium violaceum]|uniref:MYXO-CTERM sorting domain-containing protein n=1 Tax=Archangium violaceum TaxID=83451 RepID=UPI00193BB6E6|nr:MYXO-CTERM sorting domain-containing protein [Archangium violaceum]QRK05565.1 hypothetical protein JQX13_36220 [Archangium violaceum]
MRLLSLGAVGGLVMFAAAHAHADWRTGMSVPERPNDVLEVWGPEKVSLGFSEAGRSGAYLFVDGGVPWRISAPTASAESAGTYYVPSDDCFLSVRRDGLGTRNLLGADGGTCGKDSLDNRSITLPESDVLRVKHAAQGGAAALVSSFGSFGVYLSETSIYDSLPFTPAYSPPDSLSRALGVVRTDGGLHALVGTPSSNSLVYWITSSGLKEKRSQSPSMGAVMAIDMFPAGSPVAPHAVVGTQQGFLQGTLQDAGTPLRAVQVLDGWSVKSLSMNVMAGGDAGTGFGMAVVSRADGGTGVMGSVPMLADTEAGRIWRFRPLPAEVASAPLKEVACTGASYCVFTVDRAGGNNIFVYTNDAGPSISASALSATVVDDPMGASVTFDESVPGQLTFAANDPEGDPVLVTASHQLVGSTPWTVTPVSGAPGDPVVFQVTPGAICQREAHVGTFLVRAADGLPAHDASKTFQVYVKHTRAPGFPSVVFPDGREVPSGPVAIELAAGGAPLLLRALGGDTTAAGCRIQKRWEPRFSGTGVPSLEQDGGTAVITPPRVFCQAGGGDFGFRLQVEDEGGLSTFRDYKVHVAPWGQPNVVFSADSGVEYLNAGQSLALTPDNPRPHDCVDSPSFPGVVRLWHVTSSDGGVPGGGVTFRDGSGGPPIQGFPAPASALVVEAPHCVDTTQLMIRTEHHVGAADGLAGPSSVRQVMIQTDKEPFDAGVLVLEEDPKPSGELVVSVMSNLNCAAERGLRADLQLEPMDGGGPTQVAQVDIPGEWRFPLGLGCQGGDFQLKASMTEETGLRSLVMTKDVAVPSFDAGLEPLPPEDAVLVARCNEGVRATLTQTFPPEACQTPAVTWTQVDGPELEQGSLSGHTVSLATRDTGLDSLVGRSVVMQVTADAGPEKSTGITHTLPITVEPFVKLRRRTEVPAASETGLVGVSVEMLNTTACGVTDVRYVERMEGMTYVEGSAKFDGQPVMATWNEGALTVTGLSLGSEVPGTLTYVARPHLVGERRMEGEARLRDVPISIVTTPGPQVPDSGCGCTSSGPGPVLFALGALVAAVRRRRR